MRAGRNLALSVLVAGLVVAWFATSTQVSAPPPAPSVSEPPPPASASSGALEEAAPGPTSEVLDRRGDLVRLPLVGSLDIVRTAFVSALERPSRPCRPGTAGCRCESLDDAEFTRRCDAGLVCLYDTCWGGRVPLPTTYYYTDRAAQDAQEVKRLIQSHFDLRPGQHAVDVGCGRGPDTVVMAEDVGPTGLVFATDIDKGALAQTLETVAKTATRPTAPVKTVWVESPRSTGLESVPDGSIHLMLFLNSVYFQRQEPPEEARAYLQSFLRKLVPGGRLIYHYDWLPPERLTHEEHVKLFVEAGFDDEVGEIPMPPQIPAKTQIYYDDPAVFTPPPHTRGFIAVFKRPMARAQ
ncbi:MAG: methyltransferase domain-containing protein [Myxococcota bacterium]|jgi:SAM-dependent methyltransferase|nr:methyltransferase domain-containing protein [Myxococcota bacterium]